MPDPIVAQWVGELSNRMHAKFARLGLVPARESSDEASPKGPTVSQWTERYIAKHHAKAGTIKQLEATARGLCRFFKDRTTDSITPGDAEDFRKWLETNGNERSGFTTGLAKNTVRRRIGRCKQMFRYAVLHKLIPENPFQGEASVVVGNEARMEMVSHPSIERCIDACDNEDLRVILALARYGGLRRHETLIQRWSDIDLENGRMLVRSHKTPAERICPIFPELRPHLVRSRRAARDGVELVQTTFRLEQNIAPAIEAVTRRAGIALWQKPMQNLRASRETELMARFPQKDVTSWLGNSPRIANKHYAMVMQE